MWQTVGIIEKRGLLTTVPIRCRRTLSHCTFLLRRTTVRTLCIPLHRRRCLVMDASSSSSRFPGSCINLPQAPTDRRSSCIRTSRPLRRMHSSIPSRLRRWSDIPTPSRRCSSQCCQVSHSGSHAHPRFLPGLRCPVSTARNQRRRLGRAGRISRRLVLRRILRRCRRRQWWLRLSRREWDGPGSARWKVRARRRMVPLLLLRRGLRRSRKLKRQPRQPRLRCPLLLRHEDAAAHVAVELEEDAAEAAGLTVEERELRRRWSRISPSLPRRLPRPKRQLLRRFRRLQKTRLRCEMKLPLPNQNQNLPRRPCSGSAKPPRRRRTQILRRRNPDRRRELSAALLLRARRRRRLVFPRLCL
jgi:hypothetical protein